MEEKKEEKEEEGEEMASNVCKLIFLWRAHVCEFSSTKLERCYLSILCCCLCKPSGLFELPTQFSENVVQKLEFPATIRQDSNWTFKSTT